MPELSDPYALVEWARDIGKTYPFIDSHVHPFDVLTGDTEYQIDDQVDGLYHKGSSVYHSPTIQANIESRKTPAASMATLNSLLLASRLTYTHLGPVVLKDQLDVVGLTGALLLPVARVPGVAENLLQVTGHMFPKDGRLFPGCAFPIGIPPDNLDSFFREAYDTWRIRAIKLHPNLAAIDPLSDLGRECIEAMLAVAGSLDLPVVIHGGRTLALEPTECREYGTLPHLANVDWSLSSAPVIIAHCGLYCLTEEEAIAALDVLDGLFERYPNLMADTSNLEPPILRLVLERIDRNRLLYGSDALYIPIWKSWIRFLHTLSLVTQHPEADLIRIASLNPIRCLNLNLSPDLMKFNNT